MFGKRKGSLFAQSSLLTQLFFSFFLNLKSTCQEENMLYGMLWAPPLIDTYPPPKKKKTLYKCIKILSTSVEIMCVCYGGDFESNNLKKNNKNILLCYFCNNDDIIY